MFSFLRRAIDCIFGAPESEAPPPPPPPPPPETKGDDDEKPPVVAKPGEEDALRQAIDEVNERRKAKEAGAEIPPPPKVPAEAAPYRKAADPPPPLPPVDVSVHGDLKCEVEGNTTEARFSKDGIDRIKVKTERRARRHFGGTSKEIRHRVTEKTADSITFAYFRRSGKPLKIRWTRASVSDPLTAQMKGDTP